MYWYCGEHFDFLVSFLQEWVFFRMAILQNHGILKSRSTIYCLCSLSNHLQNANASPMNVRIQKARQFGHVVNFRYWKSFVAFYFTNGIYLRLKFFFLFILLFTFFLFDRCIYCRCTVPDLRWCKWSICTNSRRLIWQSWTNMKIIRLCCGFCRKISLTTPPVVILESKIII